MQERDPAHEGLQTTIYTTVYTLALKLLLERQTYLKYNFFTSKSESCVQSTEFFCVTLPKKSDRKSRTYPKMVLIKTTDHPTNKSTQILPPEK